MAAPMEVSALVTKFSFFWIILALLCLTVGSQTQESDETDTEPQQGSIKLESVFDSVVPKKQDTGGSHAETRSQSHPETQTDQPIGDSDASDQESKLFSLTSLIKSFLNPVLEEFQVGSEEESEEQDQTLLEKSPPESVSNDTVSIVNTSNITETVVANGTANETDSSKKFKFECVGRNVTENTTLTVRLVNSSTLLEVLSFDKNRTSGDCVLVMFYAPWCQFCAKTAPHYNALARAFPQLEVLAVDAVHFSNLNARFGTVAVPNVMLFHQSRSAVRFNHTERVFSSFIQFIKNVTGLEPNSTVNLTDTDYLGPLSSVPTQDPDYLLWMAWVFVITCSSYMFVNSQYGQQAINRVRILWQEHQHIE